MPAPQPEPVTVPPPGPSRHASRTGGTGRPAPDAADAPRRGARPAALAPAAFIVLWSSAFVAGVPGVHAASPLLLMFARFGLAGVLLAAYALVKRAPWPRGRALAHVAVCGLLIQAVQFGSFYTLLGKGYPAAVISLVQGLSPVVIAVAGRFLGERLSLRQGLGFAIGATGAVLAVADRVSLSAAGAVLCLLGLFGLSFGTLYQKRFVPDMDVRTGTAAQLLVSALALGPLCLVAGEPRVSDWTAFGGSVAWMVLINSIAAFVLLNAMLRRMPANRVSTAFFLTPSVTAVMAWLVVGQALKPLAIVGLVLGGTGTLLATRRVRPRT
ncbi:EamA family transporter [Actinomadura sp. J1-007]|nr:EamA family transporter [Actinomadura sp. J1-007]